VIEIEKTNAVRDSRLGLLKSDRRMMLQYAVTTALADSVAINDAILNLLQAFCILGGWEFGEIWLVDQEKQVLRSAGFWKAPKFGDRNIEFLSHQYSFTRGTDIPGAVWANGKPVWLSSFINDRAFPYATVMSNEGMKCIIGSPVRNQGEVIGVIMLFSQFVQHADLEFIELMKSIGNQIGEYIRRRWTEDALKQSERRFRALIENSSDAIFLIERDGKIHYATPSVEHVLGYSTDDLLGKNAFEYIHPDEQDGARRFFTSIIRKPGKNFTAVYRVRHKDGSWRWMEGIGTNLVMEPAVQAIVINHRDITEYKREEEEVLALNTGLEQLVGQRTEQLRAANEELEAFSYSVAHDLRAPLRALNGFTQLLEEHSASQLDGEGKRLLGIIKANTGRMGLLIDDLMAFSRVSRQELEPVTGVDMNLQVRGILDEFKREYEGENISIIAGDLPRAWCSEPMIRQVWVNLISNAVKFTRNKSERIIEIGSDVQRGENVYFVKDNGIGFDNKFAEKIFGLFQRLHNMKAYDGAGAGLAIVKRIIHRHGGKVWAEGTPGAGAIVYFSLPKK
jgi:PAS domain S-box-containing protein